MKEVSRCIKQFLNFGGAFLQPAESTALLNICIKVCEIVNQDKNVRLDQFKGVKKQMDEEEIDEFLENIEKMDHVWSYTMDISGVLLKNMPD